jgi:hypothetical protein
MSQEVNQQELTAEQIQAYKKASLDFYKERISFMKVQLEYERLSAEIDEMKLKGLIARLKYAQITTPQEEETENEEQLKEE